MTDPTGQPPPGTPYGPPPYQQWPPAPQGAPAYPPQYAGQQRWPPPAPPYPPAGYPVPAPRPSFPHAEPRQYHQMLRTWTYAWWRPVLGILLLAAGMLIVLPVAMLPVLAAGVLIEGGKGDFFDAFAAAGTLQKVTPSGLVYLNLTLAGLVLWTWGLIRVLHQMRPRWLSSVMPKMRWRWFFLCMGIAVVALVAQFLVGLVVPQDSATGSSGGGDAMSTGKTIALALIVLLTTPLQAAGEEYAFRGYLLQAVGSLSRNRWVAILVTATLFALAHGLQNPPLFFDRFMFGLIAGWLVIRTGGLEAGIAMHVLNNFLAFGLAIAFGDISDTLNVSEVSWWNIPVTLTQSLVFAGLVTWAARRKNLETRTRPPVPEEPPATLVSA